MGQKACNNRKKERQLFYARLSGFSGLEVAGRPLVLKFVASNRAKAVGFLRVKKSSAHLPSEGK
jgi:hypothetical protein